jgi:hypothetical protein
MTALPCTRLDGYTSGVRFVGAGRIAWHATTALRQLSPSNGHYGNVHASVQSKKGATFKTSLLTLSRHTCAPR